MESKTFFSFMAQVFPINFSSNLRAKTPKPKMGTGNPEKSVFLFLKKSPVWVFQNFPFRGDGGGLFCFFFMGKKQSLISNPFGSQLPWMVGWEPPTRIV